MTEDVLGFCRAGITGIGIWRRKLDDFGDERAIELLAESGLEVSSVSWAGSFTGEAGYSYHDAVRDARDALATAGLLRAHCLVLVSGPRRIHTRRHARRLVIDGMRELADQAHEFGVRLAVQPMLADRFAGWSFLHGLDDTLELLDEAKTGMDGLVFDPYHLQHDPRLIERIPEIVNRVCLVQVGDRNAAGGGSGHGPRDLTAVEDVVAHFCEAGFEGCVEVDNWSPDAWQSNYDELLRACSRRLEYLLVPA